MEKEKLTQEDWKVFRGAVKKIKGEKATFPKDETKAIAFINNIFCDDDCFNAAWSVAGFPFKKINEINLKLTVEEHPQFEKLFTSQV